MVELKPNYVTDSGNKKVAVQLPIKTFEKIEELLENYGLYQLMKEDADAAEALTAEEAKAYYNRLKKKK